MNGKDAGEWWAILQDHHLRRPPGNELSHAVSHSKGRGKFKEMAREVIVPELVLDKIIQSKSDFWTDQRSDVPCGTGSRCLPASEGGAVTARGRMEGVRIEVGAGAKKSGRAHVLRTRRSQYRQPRKPGVLASVVQYWYRWS